MMMSTTFTRWHYDPPRFAKSAERYDAKLNDVSMAA
jgi:hypothetical protein